MASQEDHERALRALTRAHRDRTIYAAYADGLTKARIHDITGISRVTIDRILKEPPVTQYKAVLSGNPDPNIPNHIVLVCTWENGLGEELARIDTGIPNGTDISYEIESVKETAEEKLNAAGWTVGTWSESGGDWYADATGGPEEDDEVEDDTDRYDEHGEYKPTREEDDLEDAIEEGEDEAEYWNP